MLVTVPHPKVLVGSKRQVFGTLGKHTFSRLHQQLSGGRQNLAESVTSYSWKVKRAWCCLSICSHTPAFASCDRNVHTLRTAFLILRSAVGWHFSSPAYTKLPVGIVSLWSGIIFHFCYQMDARWVIVASTSARGPPQSPWAWACRFADPKLALQRNTLQDRRHLFPTLMTFKKTKKRKSLQTSFSLTRCYICKRKGKWSYTISWMSNSFPVNGTSKKPPSQMTMSIEKMKRNQYIPLPWQLHYIVSLLQAVFT